MPAGIVAVLLKNANDVVVIKLRHNTGTTLEPLQTCFAAHQIGVEDLNRDDAIPLAIVRLPDGSESAAAECLEQEISTITERVASLQRTALAELAPQLYDVLLDAARIGARFLKALFPYTSGLKLLAKPTNLVVPIFG